MQLRDMLVAELMVLANILPVHQRAVLRRNSEWLSSETPESFHAFILAAFELGKVQAAMDTLSRLLKEYDEQV